MRRLLIAVIAGLFVALGSMAQGLSGAALLTIINKPDFASIDKYVSVKGYKPCKNDDPIDADYRKIWGINLAGYSGGICLAKIPSKPMYLLMVEFGRNPENPKRWLTYRSWNSANINSILSYFRKLGYKKVGQDYDGDIYHKEGSKYELRCEDAGSTILLEY